MFEKMNIDFNNFYLNRLVDVLLLQLITAGGFLNHLASNLCWPETY
jgi:hypothetical protein